MAAANKDVPERAAIVTGGSSGIGLEIARLLGRRGHSLTISARRPDKLEAAAAELRGEGIEVQSVAGLLGEESAVRKVVAAHRERYGRCDVLANNAGVGIHDPVGGLSAKKTDVQIGINLRSAMLFANACLGMLEAAAAEHRNALLVNTSSIVAVYGQPQLSVYSATKGALNAFTATAHRELAGKGIKCSSLCPGFVETPMTEWAQDGVPKHRMIQPVDIAGAVGLLLDLSPTTVIPEVNFVRCGMPTN